MTVRRSIVFGVLFTGCIASTLGSGVRQNSQEKKRVTLNVVAFDGEDHVVSDLSSKDLQVTDSGKPQPIALFRRNEEHAPVVILFDLLNDSLGAQGYGADEIIRALEHLEFSDNLYFYLLTRQGDLRPVRALPNARVKLETSNVPWTEQIRPMLEAAMKSAAALRQQEIDNVGTTHRTIEGVSAEMAPIPGRKYLIWISHGVQITRGRGLDRIDYSSNAAGIASKIDSEGITLNSVDQGSSVSGTSATFEDYANLTGGKVYYNDIAKAISETMAASRSSYMLQYDEPSNDGKYHKVRVSCARKGIRLQVEQGYYAKP